MEAIEEIIFYRMCEKSPCTCHNWDVIWCCITVNVCTVLRRQCGVGRRVPPKCVMYGTTPTSNTAALVLHSSTVPCGSPCIIDIELVLYRASCLVAKCLKALLPLEQVKHSWCFQTCKTAVP